MNAGVNGGVGGINFYPSQAEVHNEVSFSQVSASEMMPGNMNNREQGKQLIIQQLSKYIKLKQTEINVDLNDDILENLKECKSSHLLISNSFDIFGEEEYHKHHSARA